MLTTVLQVVTGGRGNPHWEEELFLGGDGHSGGNKRQYFYSSGGGREFLQIAIMQWYLEWVVKKKTPVKS